MKKKLLALIIPLMIATVLAIPAYANAQSPSLPHYFYGTVRIDGGPAAAGATIEARGTGVVSDTSNPITTTQAGVYGSANPLASVPRLLVQGTITDGTTIEFYVNGIKTNETAAWHEAQVEVLNLTVTSPPPPPPAGGGGGPAGGGGGGGGGPMIDLNGLKTDIPFMLNGGGQISETVKLTDPGNTFTITVPKFTRLLDRNGRPIGGLTAQPLDPATLPVPPNKKLALAFDFGPNGTVFSPPITLTMAYDPAKLPAGGKVEGIVYYDVQRARWVTLEGKIDPATKTITVKVEHFTDFAILVDVSEAPAEPAPATTALPTPAPATLVPTVTLAAPTIEPVKAPAPAPAPVSTQSPAPVPPSTTVPAVATSAPAPEPGAAYSWLDNWMALAATAVGALLAIGIVIVIVRKNR